jgi:hypothetical protein
MRRSWMTLMLLAACVAALGVFVWLKPQNTEGMPIAVSALQPAAASRVRVLRKGKVLAVLEKRGSAWHLVEPLAAPAETFQVDRLLAVLQAKASRSYPAGTAAKFELDKPQAELAINDQRFAFGAINSVTREQYVLTLDAVVPLPLNYGAAIPADAMALVRRSLFARGDEPQRFEFGTFAVTHDGKKWLVTPAQGEASQDDCNRWVAQWREGSALRAERLDPNKPEREIHITLKGGAKVTLGVTQGAHELIVRRADLGLQYVFVRDIGAQMMAPPLVR